MCSRATTTTALGCLRQLRLIEHGQFKNGATFSRPKRVTAAGAAGASGAACEHRPILPLVSSRSYASARSADEVMEDLQELYATAKDEFEMAVEETERKTVYASADRDAAKEALQHLKDAYGKAIEQSSPQVAQEIRGRVSQRIRELDNANTALQESAQAD